MLSLFKKQQQDNRDQEEIDFENALKKDSLREQVEYDKFKSGIKDINNFSDEKLEEFTHLIFRVKGPNYDKDFVKKFDEELKNGEYDQYPRLKENIQKKVDTISKRNGFDVYPINDGVPDNSVKSMDSMMKRMDKKSKGEEVKPFNSNLEKIVYGVFASTIGFVSTVAAEGVGYEQEREQQRERLVQKREKQAKKENKKANKEEWKQHKKQVANKKPEVGNNAKTRDFDNGEKQNTRSRIRPKM